MNLDNILVSETNEKTYYAWKSLWETYYEINKIQEIINVCMVRYGNELFYVAIKDILADAELFRVYGFSTWPLELLDTITSRNVLGYGKFIHELLPTIINDPNEKKIQCIYQTIISILTLLNMSINDDICVDDTNTHINLGNILKMAIINNV